MYLFLVGVERGGLFRDLDRGGLVSFYVDFLSLSWGYFFLGRWKIYMLFNYFSLGIINIIFIYIRN